MLFGVQKNQTRDKNIFLEKKIIKCTHKTPKQQNTKTMFNLVYEKNLLNRHINRNTYIFKKKRLHVLFIITPARLFESYKFFHFRMHRPNFQSCMKINFNTKSNFSFTHFTNSFLEVTSHENWVIKHHTYIYHKNCTSFSHPHYT